MNNAVVTERQEVQESFEVPYGLVRPRSAPVPVFKKRASLSARKYSNLVSSRSTDGDENVENSAVRSVESDLEKSRESSIIVSSLKTRREEKEDARSNPLSHISGDHRSQESQGTQICCCDCGGVRAPTPGAHFGAIGPALEDGIVINDVSLDDSLGDTTIHTHWGRLPGKANSLARIAEEESPKSKRRRERDLELGSRATLLSNRTKATVTAVDASLILGLERTLFASLNNAWLMSLGGVGFMSVGDQTATRFGIAILCASIIMATLAFTMHFIRLNQIRTPYAGLQYSHTILWVGAIMCLFLLILVLELSFGVLHPYLQRTKAVSITNSTQGG